MSFITKPLARLTDWALHPQKKYVYTFQEGSAEDKELLGNKGANLCEMARLGLPVPAGFVISSEACMEYFQAEGKGQLPNHLVEEYTKGLHEIEKRTGMVFGGSSSGANYSKDQFPLLLSVRSGAAVSMPGMMDTILNLGINDDVVSLLAKLTANPRFAYDTYRRFLQMFGDVVLGIDTSQYEEILSAKRKSRNVQHDSELNYDDLLDVVNQFKVITPVPSDPYEQLRMAVEAVFKSWFNPRAVAYRDINNITSVLGTAVTIQSMVYGNYNTKSGSGVAFTRNPGTGENLFYGEYLANAEGEDVVAGIRTPVDLNELRKEQPAAYDALIKIEKLLERHYRDMQDIEFTIQNGHLYILQTRSGKRTPRAAVKIAVAMTQENLITEREALLRVDAESMNFFLHPMIDPSLEAAGLEGLGGNVQLVGHGLASSPGAACGVAVFTNEDAIEYHAKGVNVILCREQTSPNDIRGLSCSIGVLTTRGGISSHASIVMRNMGKTAVVGCKGIIIDIPNNMMRAYLPGGKARVEIKRGDVITIDGSSGNVYVGEVPMVPAGRDEDFKTILRWANKFKSMKVFTNCENLNDATKASELGAEGVGLIRSEHMFLKDDRILLMQGVLLSSDIDERQHYLHQIMKFQQQDFLEIIRTMHGKELTVRLLDYPLNEFMPCISTSPTYQQDLETMARKLKMDFKTCEEKVRGLQESNPMMGNRGCRLSILYPDITDMQVRALLGAAVQGYAYDVSCSINIMIPLVSSDHEIEIIKPIIKRAADSIFKTCGFSIDYKIGCMIETPRACLRADAIAKIVDFVSIGSNDLTQMVRNCYFYS